MFCPDCQSEYRPGFYRCSDCDVALVEQLPTSPRDQKNVDLVMVFATQDRALADIVSSVLRARSIEFFSKYGETDVYTFGFKGAEIWVSAEDVELARDAIDAIEAEASVTPFAESAKPALKERRSIQIERYSRRTGKGTSEDIKEPLWSHVEREIRSMDRFEKPIIFLLNFDDNTETDCMAITGGNGIYHLQVADEEGSWQEAVNSRGGDREIEIWTSDQGMTTQQRFTWDTEEAVRIAKYYWEEQEPSPEVKWN